MRHRARALSHLLRASALSVAALGLASPGHAQRAGENAVTAAGDAFGTSVGNERVGIYNPFQVRGFSPVQAGNVRIQGLYFDLQADLSSRVIAGATTRVGITAQGYPFPAPTGIADFAIRTPGKEPVLSTVLTYGPYGSVTAEADAQLPITDQLSVSAGVAVGHQEQHTGGDDRVVDMALIPRWTPTPDVEIMPFFSYYKIEGREPQPIYFTGGPFLPPQIERRRYFGPSWARGELSAMNSGLLATVRTGSWTLRSGVFHSLLDLERSFLELDLNTSKEGLSDRFIAADADRRFGSTSGEVRATRAFTEGPRLHQLHFALRARNQKRRYGGGSLLPLGRLPIDAKAETAEPNFQVGAQTRDEVRQGTFGVGYEGRWRDVGELSFGVQKTDYKKSVLTPNGPLPSSRDRPWLLNAAASVHASKKLSFYAGYSRGLEESPIAPTVARNRDEAPPAILTEQKDAGLRLILPANMRLVAGVFEVSKPYFGLDNSLFFGRLGEVTHRGAEFSLAGSPVKGLTAVVGTILLDAEVSGVAVEQGLVGKRPIGHFVRYTNGALDYRLPFAEGLSVDYSYESTSSRVADRLNTFFIPPRAIHSLGSRYRFKIGKAPATLRAQLSNILNTYGWSNAGEGFAYNQPRRVSLSFSADW